MPCETRDRLTKAYNDLVEQLNQITVPKEGPSSEAWRTATEKLRAACQAALETLNTHKNEHGC